VQAVEVPGRDAEADLSTGHRLVRQGQALFFALRGPVDRRLASTTCCVCNRYVSVAGQGAKPGRKIDLIGGFGQDVRELNQRLVLDEAAA
jgi:hypothetical protein